MQNRVRFVALALASFVLAFLGSFFAPGAFLNRLTATALCSLLSFQSNACLAQLPRTSERAVAAVSTPPAEKPSSNNDAQTVAGCPFGVCVDIPKIPIPGGSNLGGNLVEQAKAAIIKQVGEALGVGSPLLLDQKTAYPDASDQVKNFHPKQLKITSAQDLKEPLPPGDYSIPAIAYCTQFSIHAPGQGLAYKLAPLQGKQGPAISALLARGTLQGIAPATLNAEAWRIQAGMPLKQWTSQDQALIHKLIPEYEKGLEGDYLQQLENTYNQYRAIPGIPSFNDLLKQLGPPGQLVLQLRQARQVLSDKTIAAERLPDMLYEPTGDGLPRVLPASKDSSPSHWAEVQPGIFARFTVIEGNLGRNLLEFRVTPKARASINNSTTVATKDLNKSLKISEVTTNAPTSPATGSTGLIGYSTGRGAQALIAIPAYRAISPNIQGDSSWWSRNRSTVITGGITVATLACMVATDGLCGLLAGARGLRLAVLGEEAIEGAAAADVAGLATEATETLVASAEAAGFSSAESSAIAEAKSILTSPEIENLAQAYKRGEAIQVEINGRIIQYEPNLPASGMTMFGENGFLIGPEAFTSQDELAKTVLHELYRLATSSAPASGVSGEIAASETQAASTFADRAYQFLKGKLP